MHNEDLLLVAIMEWAVNMLSKGVCGTIALTAVCWHIYTVSKTGWHADFRAILQ